MLAAPGQFGETIKNIRDMFLNVSHIKYITYRLFGNFMT